MTGFRSCYQLKAWKGGCDIEWHKEKLRFQDRESSLHAEETLIAVMRSSWEHTQNKCLACGSQTRQWIRDLDATTAWHTAMNKG